ncbi:MAG: MFS transporter, partial [Acidobacteria bacterium]|nr:MFS transporter [Acidobacteriota bacterium]
MGWEPKGRWWIVIASMLGLLVGNGPVMQFTFGTLLPPITRELGWSRGLASSALVVGIWMTGIATPVVGRLVDRFGIRAVALPGLVLFSLATASVGWVRASPAVFIAQYALMGLGAAGQTPLIYAKAISARFDRQRGLALGVAMAGVGLGAALVPQFAQGMIGISGWRGAYAGLGVLTFVLAFPAVAWVVGRPAADDQVVLEKVPAVTMPGLTGREALRSARFWSLAFSFFIVSGTTGGVMSHLVPFMSDRGVSAHTATAMVSLAGAALIGGRVLSGFLVDRIHAPYVAAVFFLAPLMGIVVLLTTLRPEGAVLGTVLVGVGLGAEVDLIAFLLSRYLGMRCFGEIYGYLFSIFLLGAGLGPFVMGVSYDRTGSYTLMLVCFAFALALAALPMLRLGAYAYPIAPRNRPGDYSGLRPLTAAYTAGRPSGRGPGAE